MSIKTPMIIVLFIIKTNLIFCQAELIKALNKAIIPIETCSPDSNFTDIEKLIPVLKGVEIIGLGEATHGTHEFFVYKHRLIKLLSSKLNFKIFIIEADFAGSQSMNEYVMFGKGNPYNALKDMGIGVWMTDEFIDMIEWMRKFNENKKDEDKIKFYGCDMQYPQLAAKKIKEYLSKNQKLNSLTANGLDWIITRNYKMQYSNSEKKLVEQTLAELDKFFKSAKDTNGNEFQFIKHCKRELELNFEYLSKKGAYSKSILRDKLMTENIRWIYNFENKEKVMYWAHNEHVAIHANQNKLIPGGYYLKKEFGTKYYSFGFSFYSGSLSAYIDETKKYEVFKIPPVSVEKSTDIIFNQCSASIFILDFKSTSTNAKINEFLNTKLYTRSIVEGYYQESEINRNYSLRKLIESFDGIIFFRNTNPSKIISKKN